MKTKIFILAAGLCGGGFGIAGTWAQSGGSGEAGSSRGSGGSAGSAGASSAASAGASASSGTANGSSANTAPTSAASAAPSSTTTATTTSGAAVDATTGTSPTGRSTTRADAMPGTPDMSPTLPSRSILDTGNAPGANAASAAGTTLPSGVTAAATAEGVSPLSGFPLSQIPTISRATPPVGADGTIVPREAATSSAGTRGPIIPAGAESLPANQRAAARRDAAIPALPTGNQVSPGAAVLVPTPPPSPIVDSAPLPARASANNNQAWVPGHYTWSGGQWTWVSGSWQRPPTPGAMWVPGSYDSTTRRWTPGHWDSSGGARR